MTQETFFEDVLDEAWVAAEQAVKAKGPENLHALDCGFAWVVIGGNEPIARYCRRKVNERAGNFSGRYGSKGYPKGWQWWGPGAGHVQAIGHKVAGAQAFQAVLGRYNIRADVGSRLD